MSPASIEPLCIIELRLKAEHRPKDCVLHRPNKLLASAPGEWGGGMPPTRFLNDPSWAIRSALMFAESCSMAASILAPCSFCNCRTSRRSADESSPLSGHFMDGAHSNGMVDLTALETLWRSACVHCAPKASSSRASARIACTPRASTN